MAGKENEVLFARIGEKMVLAIEWDVRRLRLVHAGLKKGAAHVERILSVDLPDDVRSDDADAVGRLIREVLDQQKIRTSRALLHVPRDQALLATLKLPKASREEMPAVVEFQIAKEIPFPLAQAIVDYAEPSGALGEVVDVLVGTVRREVVAHQERICSVAGLNLELLGLRPDANILAVNRLLEPGQNHRVLFVDVGPNLTEIDVIADGKLAFSRAASAAVQIDDATDSTDASRPGAEHETDDQQGSAIFQFPATARSDRSLSVIDRAVQTLLVEVTRSVEAYRSSEPGVQISRIIVAGSSGVEKPFADALSRRMDTEVELYNPARQFGWSEESGQDGQAFAALIGLVTGAAAGDLHFDFLNPKKTLTTTERRLKKAPLAAAAALLFVASAAVFYFLGVAPAKADLADTKAKVKAVQKELEELEKFERTVAQAETFERKQVIWLEELDRILRELPSNEVMVLETLDMVQSGAKLTFNLKCGKNADILELVNRLDAFRLPEYEGQYMDASSRQINQRSRPTYPVDGQIDVVILSKLDP